MWRLLCCLLLVGCTQLEKEPPPIWVLQSPLCLLFCIPQLGHVKEEVSGGGSGGTLSLSQAASTAASGANAQ